MGEADQAAALVRAQRAVLVQICDATPVARTLGSLAAALEQLPTVERCLFRLRCPEGAASKELVVGSAGPVEEGALATTSPQQVVPVVGPDDTELGWMVVHGVVGDVDSSAGPAAGQDVLDWATSLAMTAVIADQEHQKMTASVALARATLESTVDGILVVDAEGRIAGHNEKFVSMWHIDPELISSGDDAQVIASVLAQLVDPDTFIDGVRRLYGSPETTSFDELVFHDGRVFERYSQPQRVDGAVVGRVWSFRDVTRERRLQRDLSESRARVGLLVAQVNDYAIVNLDLEGQVVSWNTGAERIKGYGAEEVLGRHVSMFYSDPGSGEAEELLATAAREGRADAQGWRVRKDGSRFWADVVLTALRDEEGQLLGFGKVIRDVTDRREAELTLRRLTHRLDSVLNSAGEGICGVDASGVITFMNEAGARLLGATRESLVGRRADAVLAMAEEAAGGEEGDASRPRTGRHERPDGTAFDCELITAPIREDDETVGSVIVFRDVSERRAVDRLKDEFVSVMSHELRTPLTSVRGALGLLAGGASGELSAKGVRLVEVATASTDRLIRLVNDILDVERMTAGQLTLHLRDTPVADLVATAAEETAGLAAAAGVELVVEAGDGVLHADPDRVVQVLTNLVGNAVKFSPAGSVVELRAVHDGDVVRFDVRDHGPGIREDQLESVFERFLQVDASDTRQRGGTGLGLAISRGLVEQHGGRIWAASTPGEGSTFSVELPARGGTP